MFKTNVPARFQTELKSIYTVDAMGVIRDKVADPSRKTEREAKNIYYLIEEESGFEILHNRARSGKTNKLKEPWQYSHVLDVMEDTHQLVMVLEGTDRKMFFDMYRAPQKKMRPFDFVCGPDGKIAAHHLAHVGHRISEIFRTEGG